MAPVLIVGGAPRLRVDAVRFLSVMATGATAVALAQRLRARGATVDLLLGVAAEPQAPALRYDGRDDLERGLQEWLAQHPTGTVVMSAAINDYQVAAVERQVGTNVTTYAPGAKVPSGGDEVVIRLRPASKVIDQLPHWGHRGRLVGFKYEARESVLASAQALQRRTGAGLVVANSLCHGLQAVVQATGIQTFPDRQQLLDAVVAWLVANA